MMFHLFLAIGAMVNGHGIWFNLIRWEYGSIPLRSHNLLLGGDWNMAGF